MRRIFPESILGLLAGLTLAGSFLFTVLTVDSSQREICHRQQRSSVAVPYLINAMDDIHTLLTLPLNKSEKQRQKELSPSVLKKEQQVVQSLDDNLATFVRIERSQKPLTCN